MSNCIIQNLEYLWNKEILQKENTVLLHFTRPFKTSQLVFHFTGALKIPTALALSTLILTFMEMSMTVLIVLVVSLVSVDPVF